MIVVTLKCEPFAMNKKQNLTKYLFLNRPVYNFYHFRNVDKFIGAPRHCFDFTCYNTLGGTI